MSYYPAYNDPVDEFYAQQAQEFWNSLSEPIQDQLESVSADELPSD